MILNTEIESFAGYETDSFITKKQLAKILDNAPDYKQELLEIFQVHESNIEILKIGNSKQLLNSINTLDSQCEKIDIVSKVKDVHLLKLMDAEKALFELFSVEDKFVLKTNKSDLLLAETRYNAKTDVLDIYNFSKFANYCRDKQYEDLVEEIGDYLKEKNKNNEEEKKFRLLYKKEDKKFYLRALTSSQDYKNFGINFSVFVALISLGKYVENNGDEIYIDTYVVDDSNVYVSFTFNRDKVIDKSLSLSFSLILENDEVKRNAVSFNGLFKLNYNEKNKTSGIYLKPYGIKKENNAFPVDLLNYQHRGTVDAVFEKIKELPTLIDFFIKQVSEDAKKISSLANPEDVKAFIRDKVKRSKKPEFQIYKDRIVKKLMSITVDSTFKLFELLREVEDLFEHDDIISLNFWRNKLYESLIERK